MSGSLLALVILLIAIALAGVRIANQYERAIVFRLGRYHSTRDPGIYWLIPILEWRRTVDMRINTAAVEEQETITKDNVPVKINAVVWYRVIDPKQSVLEVKSIDNAVIQVALTTLHRNRTAFARRRAQGTGSGLPRHLGKDRRGDRALGRQSRTGRDEKRRDSGIDATRDGAGGGAPA